jgi:hypothetical protein
MQQWKTRRYVSVATVIHETMEEWSKTVFSARSALAAAIKDIFCWVREPQGT